MLLILLCFIVVIAIEARNIKKKHAPPEPCKIHTWEFFDIGTEQEYMRCTVCQNIPGHF